MAFSRSDHNVHLLDLISNRNRAQHVRLRLPLEASIVVPSERVQRDTRGFFISARLVFRTTRQLIRERNELTCRDLARSDIEVLVRILKYDQNL